MTVTSLLDKLADREQAVRTHADYLRVQLAQLTAQISKLEAELADLATTRKVMLTLGIDEHDPQPRSRGPCPTIPSTSTSSPPSPTRTGPCARKTCARYSTSALSRRTSKECAASSSGWLPAV
ncbi:hypothetical protein [Streptomyces sp. LN549]|uniref:hypothetical protein n=1 Tax=Streptomyces sp. LN549 TaxID=3112979 RepID=UPI00371B8523